MSPPNKPTTPRAHPFISHPVSHVFIFSSSQRPSKGRSESDCELNNGSLRRSNAGRGDPDCSAFPDRHKSLQMPLAPLPITKKLSSTAKKAHLMMSDEVHDYSEIYTPSAEQAKVVLLEDAGASTTSMSADSTRSMEARTDSR